MLASAGSVHAATFVVNSANDADDGLCNTTHCSLREAIAAANVMPGGDTITFAIGDVGSLQAILPSAPLPTLRRPSTTASPTSARCGSTRTPRSRS